MYDVSVLYKRDFDLLRKDFGKLFFIAYKCLTSNAVSFETLQLKLKLAYPELIPALQSTSTLQDVLCVVRLNCSLINCSYLEAVSEYCDLDEVDKAIKSYYQTMEHFCEHTLSNHKYVVSFLEDHSKHLLGCERITFRLKWETDKRTLFDIRALLEKTFKGVSQYIYIVTIGEGSVQVVCYAPQHLLGVLVKMAREKEKTLREAGLVSLSIGYCVLMDEEADKVRSDHLVVCCAPLRASFHIR